MYKRKDSIIYETAEVKHAVFISKNTINMVFEWVVCPFRNDLTPLELYPLALENRVGLITYKEAKRYST